MALGYWFFEVLGSESFRTLYLRQVACTYIFAVHVDTAISVLRRPGSYEKIVSEYDQEIPQPQTADNPMASRGRATQPSRDTRKTN